MRAVATNGDRGRRLIVQQASSSERCMLRFLSCVHKTAPMYIMSNKWCVA
jgi:hypothetical protein